ncbi:MAG: tRNA uridine-5-carboxymethylaminomethyl(34) synthesis enzyme MnmG [Oscillospiraceae bacterium]|nr:tRNA uridine-5-carboxymethylaminomethyl(34) synthesis enzyme MnmG [Oscillospiraceae bacterium]
MSYKLGEYDVAVIGAGHAGIEAALVSARMGLKTVIFTINLDTIGNMPCNPSIGGTAKGHLVKEIDALGGEMGKVADKTFIQSRILNRGKGPAVHSLRVQTDRKKYNQMMKHILEKQKNLDIKQSEIIDIILDDNREIRSLKTKTGGIYNVKAGILCCGTYLNSMIHVGDISYKGGPDGNMPSENLTKNLIDLGIDIRRFKTGTPARVHKRSIDFSKLEVQKGDDVITPFSFETEEKQENKMLCYIAYTNNQTHNIISKNITRSPMYSGKIESSGPRYCPSIEDKIVRFVDKKRHQIFVEPMGLDTEEYYLQGISTSLPEDIQNEFLRTIVGFENIEIMRPAYAIEYDCCNPINFNPTLEFKNIKGLYGAGQFNGTSGYEEAASQGLVAGINAVLKIKGEKPLILDRASSYIGVLIDDLVTKGCSDPYRIMTSRSEYRLILRQDNADQRLSPIGRSLGLISDSRWTKFELKLKNIEMQKKRLVKINLAPTDRLNEILVSRETNPIKTGIKFIEILKRPQISYKDIQEFDNTDESISPDVIEQIEIDFKYEGYIKKQIAQVENMRRIESKIIPINIIYSDIIGLKHEAIEKLEKIMPKNLGQAGRIYGVTPADITVLSIFLDKINRKR